MLSGFFYSCEKEALKQEDTKELSSNDVFVIDNRSVDNFNWVKNFQTHLQDLDNGRAPSSDYTLEEATYGLEWLFNYAYAEVISGINFGGSKKSLNIPDNNNWLELYNEIYEHIQDEENSELSFDFITVEANVEANSVDIQTHYKIAIPEEAGDVLNSEENAFSCENPPFTDQELIIAFGGREEDGLDLFLPCLNGQDCGNGPVTVDDPHLIALEAIELITNNSIRADDYCKEAGQVAAYTNIGKIYPTQIELQFIVGDTYLCPEITTQDLDNSDICDCASALTLNCIFCFTEELLISEAITSQIPEGSEIVDINLATNDIYYGGASFYDIVITYAEVTCVQDEREDPPIIIDICC